jgi:hypothetical protein
MSEHRLIDNTLIVIEGGVEARCICGWKSGPRFTSMVASALFQDHQANPKAPEPPSPYDVAREITHDAGMPWTDPRTRKTYKPGEKPE